MHVSCHHRHCIWEIRVEDAARQIYAIDGWWTWCGGLEAVWVFYEQVMGSPPPSPIATPHWQGTMSGWRHGPTPRANGLYRDGHVAMIVPTVPTTVKELRNAVNTLESFTWLPGERNTRFDYDRYSGSVPKYQGRQPFGVDPPQWKNVAAGRMPVDYPEHLSVGWRTLNRAWVKFPSRR
jgi:hypothetical protein